MIELRHKLKVPRHAYAVRAQGRIVLPFEARQKSRQRAALESGEEVALLLPRGEVLRGGDRLVASDGRVIEVVAAIERVLHVTCESATALARVAYHLGNRHVPVEVGDGYLRLAADHVLEGMVRQLGATVEAMDAPLEPEAGAYAAGHHHGTHGPETGAARIHEYGSPATDAGTHAHHHHGPDGHTHASHEQDSAEDPEDGVCHDHAHGHHDHLGHGHSHKHR